MRGHCWLIRQVGLTWALVIGETILVGNMALAQVIPDDTLGAESSTVAPYVIQGRPSDRIDGGAIRGANLFHSFEQFSIAVGQGAYFTNPDGVDNILSRVTGNDPSNLFGTLGVLGDANLFLLNPNGVLFGPEARLDLQGSFLASTADSLVFPNGDAYSALDPQPPSLLTVSAPLGLQYGSQSAGAITAQDSDLYLEPGQSLVLVGGTVDLDNSFLEVEGGHIELGAIADTGTVGLEANGERLSLDFPDAMERADISLTNGSLLEVAAEEGGGITIMAQNIDVLGSELVAGIGNRLGAEGNQSGDITLHATGAISIGQTSGVRNVVSFNGLGDSGDINITAESLSVTDFSTLDTANFGTGNAGSMIINADNRVVFDGRSLAFSNVEGGAKGNGGDIEINTASLEVLNESRLIADTRGRGNAGNVIINAADRVVFDTSGGAFSSVDTGAMGDGGDILINASSVEVLNGAELIAATSGQGNAGDVIINAGDRVVFDGVGTDGESFSTASSSVETGAVGDGGDIIINAASLEVLNGAELVTATSGQGDAGDVIINAADRVVFDTGGNASSSVDTGVVGNGGDIIINAGSLEVLNSGQLNADTLGQGNAGKVIINAEDHVVFDNGFASSQVQEEAVGNGGNIEITTGALFASNGVLLNADTLGQGNAGDVIINAEDRVVFDTLVLVFSGVRSGAVGDGGDIIINAASLEVLNMSLLEAVTEGQGDAGDVIINAEDRVVFEGSNADFIPTAAFSSVDENAVGVGGNIKITTGTLSLTNAFLRAETSGQGNAGRVILDIEGEFRAVDSDIRATAEQASGGEIDITARDIRLFGDSDIRTNVASGAGRGGDITLTADTILAFDDSDILAFAQDGQGGDITLNTRSFLGENYRPDATVADPEELDGNDRVDLNASGALSGVISLPDVTFIENDLVELPERPVNPETLAASSCVVRSQTQAGRFIITGSGSLPERPGEATILPYSTGSIRPLPVEPSSDAGEALPWRRGEPIVESQGVYPLTDGRLVLSRECS